jgi:site-specific recombinase XerD
VDVRDTRLRGELNGDYVDPRKRHTCLTGLVRGGKDLVLVTELAGHRRLDTTRRYSLPSEADRQQAMDDLQIEF